MRWLASWLLLCLATALPARADPLQGAALAQALREGGLVLYMRHPATDRSGADRASMDLADCATQRNLSEAGRLQAQEIGAAMRAIGMRVARLLTSEYCRARDTATLMEVAAAEVDGDLNEGARMAESGPNAPHARALRMMLAAVPPAGSVTLIVAHRPNLVDAAGRDFADMAEGEIAVFRPQPEAPGYRLLARIAPGAWAALVAAALPR